MSAHRLTTEPSYGQSEIDEDSAPLDARDRLRLAQAEPALGRGLALKRWWEAKTGRWADELASHQLQHLLDAGIHPHSFRVLGVSDQWQQSDSNYGFFDGAQVAGHDRRVMGLAQQMFYDRPKFQVSGEEPEGLLERWQGSVRDFVLKYFLRFSSSHLIGPHIDDGQRTLERYLRPVSWCPTREERRRGNGFSRLYYKRRDNGRVGRFREVDQEQIDLQEVELPGRYEWIVLGVHQYGVAFEIAPSGLGSPHVVIPLERERLGVVSHELIVCDDRGREGQYRGDYGFGYALLPDPDPDAPAPPEQELDVGFRLIRFLVKDDGEILTRGVAIENRPRLIDDVSFNPLISGLDLAEKMSFGLFSPALAPVRRLLRRTPLGGKVDPFGVFATLANAATGLLAARELCISRDRLDKELVTDYARSHEAMIMGSRGVWRKVSDWSMEVPQDWISS